MIRFTRRPAAKVTAEAGTYASSAATVVAQWSAGTAAWTVLAA